MIVSGTGVVKAADPAKAMSDMRASVLDTIKMRNMQWHPLCDNTRDTIML